jgi:lysophospholipase L1-like esterase
MLGDSIVNDTSSSQYERLLGRACPACKVTKVTSVRGSTGCWWYKDENRVEEWVLKHKPNLLMIGGISQRDDVDAIRSVIQQVRAKAPEVEVLLMTGAFGATDPRKDKGWTEEVPAEGTGYRTRLQKLAMDEKCGFLDMTGPWGNYIRESKCGMGWFKRDPIHANERGFQILGRILAAFLGPEK